MTIGEDAPLYAMVKKWAAEFKRRWESLEDCSRPGKPVSFANIQATIMAD